MLSPVNEQNFSQEVLESSSPVLVDFSAPWCGLCRIIQPILREFQPQWSGQVKLVRVNADENLKLANAYRLKSLPTLLLFDQGKVVQRLEGFKGRDDLYIALEKMIVTLLPNSTHLFGKGASTTSL
ncbi:MAG: thioredoxin [Symploca sp. SIO3C6]|uniref:Thioredoxin n=1 Tax=Symploca sp. SIO1C4 TaxID=2607765 RepID=A0A6B3N6I8_9CYAN|nr:thioredoxin [Symploca sp. SIO3C6]NER27220.1 thioredoxin [Symploca sp. SIO1C4]NET05619.1 thioredoxin [Symploca sp. SIO2B6]